MANILRSPTELSFQILKGCVRTGGAFVDATCGNGHDTLRLAEMAPSALYAFDIQAEALDNTGRLLTQNGFSRDIENGTIRLIHDTHANMSFYINRPVDCIVFNLGYLPGGDKDMTTKASTTLYAVKRAVSMLRANGVLCVTMYPGHAEGLRERDVLLDWSASLDPSIYHSVHITMNNQRDSSPETLMITRKKDI